MAIAGIFVLATLAGCAETEPAAVDAIPEPVRAACSLKMVLVDDAIVPVEGANISIEPADITITTDASGGFCLPWLPNGTYTITVSKPGYVTERVTYAVQDADNPPPLKLQIRRDIMAEPFIVEDKFDGLLACSVRLPTGGFNDGCGAFGDDGLGSTQRKQIEFAEGNIDWIQTELVWAPNSPLSQTLCTRGKEADLYPIGDVCAGPHIVRYLDDVQVTADAIDRGQWFEYIVFPEHVVPVGSGIDGSGGAVIQQDFQLFTHAFYNMQPHGGWTFGADGPHP